MRKKPAPLADVRKEELIADGYVGYFRCDPT